jgi:HlyD family secretion protein
MSKIYRKVALERLSSPEQLDQLMQVTNPQGWIALSALWMLLLAAVLWGIFGSIPTEASGQGILLRHGGVSELVAAGSGQVEEVMVAEGDALERGQVVARIRQDSLSRQIQDTEKKKEELEAEYRDLESYVEEQKRLSATNLTQKQADLERSIDTLERQVGLLEERIRVQRDLLVDGLITQQAVLALEQELNTTRDQLAAARLELNGLDLRRLETEQGLEQLLESRRAVLRDVDIQLRDLRGSLEENVHIVSPAAGRVLELLLGRGDVVSPGEPVLSMELASEELIAVIFVPAEQGKQVRRGMKARVVPSTVRREEHGFMLGEVIHVSEFPSTSRGMQRLLANEKLVSDLMEPSPPIQVDVALERSSSTPSGYRWSSSRGPDLEISSGTLADGSVIIKEDRPIHLLIPKIRKHLGL